MVRPWARHIPDAVALSEGKRKIRYGDLVGHIESTGRWLQAQGVRPGDRVMIVGENSIALALYILAIGEIDAWPLVANARISAREIDGIYAHSEARLALFTTAVSEDAAEHARRLGAVATDIAKIGRFAVGKLNRAAMPGPVMQDGTQQVGALIYTSGTTGSPKGVMLSHRNVLFTAAVGGTLRDMGQDDKVYGVLPMSHIVGFSTCLTMTLMFGACLELVPKFEASTCLQALKEAGITRLQGVPTIYQRLLENSGGQIACPALKTIGVAWTPCWHRIRQLTTAPSSVARCLAMKKWWPLFNFGQTLPPRPGRSWISLQSTWLRISGLPKFLQEHPFRRGPPERS
jgi:acyl-CoA synthetase (AMP-forming)/AMP-acid ligase II